MVIVGSSIAVEPRRALTSKTGGFFWTMNNVLRAFSRQKTIRRESGRDGKILRDHRQDSSATVRGIGNLAR